MMDRPPWLQHRFVAGLGFRTRWTFRAIGGRERWLPGGDGAPPAAGPSAGDGGWACAQQVAALLLGAVPRSTRARTHEMDEQALARLLKAWMPNAMLHASAQPAPSNDGAHAAALVALSQRLVAGDLVLLRYALAGRAPRWCLVSGVEVAEACADTEQRCSAGRVMAWLLLDTALPAVWGCGYNARLEATPQGLVRRTLDGGLAQMQIVSWLAIRLPPHL